MIATNAVSALTGLCLVLSTFLFAIPDRAEAKKVEVYSRTFLRPDKSRTVSIRDDNKMRKELRTYNRRGVLIWKGVYRLDKYGRHRSAEIFDAQNKLLFKAAYGFDRKGRLRQERFYSGKGTLMRLIDYPYDRYGKKLKPIARNGKYALLDGKDVIASTHPELIGVKQAQAAKKAGRAAAPAYQSGAASNRRSSYGAPSSSRRTSKKATGTRRSTVNTKGSGGSSLRLNLNGSTSRYRNR